MRYINVLHSVRKLDYTVSVCPTMQSCILLCCLHLQSFIQNVYACISISVMQCMAVRTLPYTNGQIFHQRILISAAGTCLTVRIHSRHFYNIIPIPDSLIFKLNVCNDFYAEMEYNVKRIFKKGIY